MRRGHWSWELTGTASRCCVVGYRVNMNPDDIEHVSYTIMDLSLSPSGKYLLAATDSNRNFIFSVSQGVP
jgi:hypothetical protein